MLATPLTANAVAPPPQWWSLGSPPPVNSNASEPLGVANIGQAKYMAKCALEAVNQIDPSVATLISTDLVGIGKPIPSWTPPAANSQAAQEQYAPLLVGQLKAIAAPFYTRLNATAPAWLGAERAINGTHFPGSIFPWTTTTTDDSNRSIASIGQLKAVFALHFENFRDADQDGLDDEWEIANGFDPSDGSDANADSDGDGMQDGAEYVAGFDIYDPDENQNGHADGYEDFDDDSYINREEVLCCTNANAASSRPDGTAASMVSINGVHQQVLLVRNYNFDFQSLREASFGKQGYQGYLSGSAGTSSPSSPQPNGLETSSNFRPRYYLNKSVLEKVNQRHHNSYSDEDVTVEESSAANGQLTTLHLTKKVNGAYTQETSASGNFDWNWSHTQIEDYGPITITDEGHYLFPRDPLTWWHCVLGNAQEKISSDTEAKIAFSYPYDWTEGPYHEDGFYENSRTTTLSDEYTDRLLITDLGEQLSTTNWSSPGQWDSLEALFRWDYPGDLYALALGLPLTHVSATFKDVKYRIVSGVPGGIPSTTLVKFIWKEVFVPQQGEGGEIKATWYDQGGIPISSGPNAGQVATLIRELPHPDKPGSISPDFNRNWIYAPDKLAAINPGETALVSYTHTNSKGISKTDMTVQRGMPITFQVDLLDQKNNPTLTASGSGTVTLWERKKDGTWANHPFPFAIPAEQSAGPSSDPGSYLIQGLTPGEVTLQITANGAVRDEAVIQVRRIDLDVDSDNSGLAGQSNGEELVESTPQENGKVLLCGGSSAESDANGIPLHPDQLTELKLHSANLPSYASITLTYPDKAIKIWKTPPGQTPASTDLIVPGQPYQLSADTELSIQPLGVAAGLTSIVATVNGTSSETSDEVLVRFISVSIEPDTNMAGVLGDIVKSAKANSTIKHFVTPKKSTDSTALNQDYVVLKAVGVTSKQITVGDPNQIVQWDGGEPIDPNNPQIEPLKRRVKRDTAGNGPTEVKIKMKQSGQVAAQMDVWVVWADGNIANAGNVEFIPTYGATVVGQAIDKTIGGVITDSAMLQCLQSPNDLWKFVFTIQPSWIVDGFIAGQDVPDLSGMLPANTLVPGGDGEHPVLGPYTPGGSGGKFKFGVSHYWDVSRQMQITIKNPNMIPKNDFKDNCFALYSTQPQASSIPVPFPSDPVMGNDDVGDDRNPALIAGDESNNPYVALSKVGLTHTIGQITSFDAPRADITVAAGAANRTYEELNEFREFARLKLPSGWYRVSDYVNWTFDLKTNFINGQWHDNGCNPTPNP